MVTRDYELGFILNPEVNEEQTRAILGRVEQIVANHGGQIVRVNQWGRRRLSYPIDHHRDGYYVFIDMILTPETVAELDRTLKVSEDVLRHLMKHRDAKAVQKEREARAAAAAAAAEAAAKAATAATPTTTTEAVEAAAEEAVLEAAADAAAEAVAEEAATEAAEAAADAMVAPVGQTDEEAAAAPTATEEIETA